MPNSEHGISPCKALYGMPYSQEMLGDTIICTEQDCNCYSLEALNETIVRRGGIIIVAGVILQVDCVQSVNTLNRF